MGRRTKTCKEITAINIISDSVIQHFDLDHEMFPKQTRHHILTKIESLHFIVKEDIEKKLIQKEIENNMHKYVFTTELSSPEVVTEDWDQGYTKVAFDPNELGWLQGCEA